MYGLIRSGEMRWTSDAAFVSYAIAALLLIAFVCVEEDGALDLVEVPVPAANGSAVGSA